MILECVRNGASHICRHSKATSPRLRRQQSSNANSSLSQSVKIRAAPFLLSPSTAIDRLHTLALLVSSNSVNRGIGEILGRFAPNVGGIARKLGIGGKVVNMKSMKAVYWPIWRVDALMEGLALEDGGENKTAYITAKEAHMPGHSYAPLSHISFAEPHLPDPLPLYNSKMHLQHLGLSQDFTAVPFTISPIGMMKMIRKKIGKRGHFHSITVDEARWKEVMMACYPIMFPIYVGDFEQTRREGNRYFSVVVDAHREDNISCRASWPHPSGDNSNDTHYVNPAPAIPQSRLIMPKTLFGIGTDTQFPRYALDKAYTAWLAPTPNINHSIPPSPLAGISDPIDWDDARIQDWSGPDRRRNMDYCDISSALWNRTVLLTDLSRGLASRVGCKDPDPETSAYLGMGEDDGIKQPAQSLSKHVKENEREIWSLKAKWGALKPKWLVEWEAKSSKASKVWEKRSDGLSSNFPGRLSK